MVRVSAKEDPDQLLRYIDARADLADRYAAAQETPEEIEARRREHRMLRLLIGMVLLIVLGGFIISIAGLLLTGGTAQ